MSKINWKRNQRSSRSRLSLVAYKLRRPICYHLSLKIIFMFANQVRTFVLAWLSNQLKHVIEFSQLSIDLQNSSKMQYLFFHTQKFKNVFHIHQIQQNFSYNSIATNSMLYFGTQIVSCHYTNFNGHWPDRRQVAKLG